MRGLFNQARIFAENNVVEMFQSALRMRGLFNSRSAIARAHASVWVSIRLADAWPFQRRCSLPRQDATEKPCCERRARRGALHPELPLSSTLYHDFRRVGMLNRVMRAPPALIPYASLLESRLMRGDS